jgi:threonine dehydrogenase-like Zn-dependent dehydrogenase
MNEALKPLERIRLPVEQEVWNMFTGALPQDFAGSILLVGDDEKGTLAGMAADSYPESKIFIVDRSQEIIQQLTPEAEKIGWSVIAGDITDSDTIDEILQKTSGGADAVFMKHGIHLNLPKDQENVIAGLFGVCRRDGFVGFSVPTVTAGWWVLMPDVLIDQTISSGLFHSTVYVARNTQERLRILRG